jgi:CheY-like chemotaxis protein
MDEKYILIVDDEAEICLLLSSMLKKMGYKTLCAYNLSDGIEKVKKHDTICAVFLDLHLPDGIGFELMPEIKNADHDIKVIVISAYDSMGERQRASREGVDYFIGKPFDRQKVIEALKVVS